jgi:Cu/Ag efflux protein CusF
VTLRPMRDVCSARLSRARMTLRVSATLPVIGLALVFGACGKAPSASPIKRYRLHGVVVRVERQTHLVAIKHERIEGWMGAMTMAFPVRPQEELLKLSPGIEITATVFVQDLDYWVGDIKTGPGNRK